MSEKTWTREAKSNAGWLIFLGFLTAILGVLAMVAPTITGVAVTLLVGVLLTVTGISRIIHAFKSGNWGTGIWGTIIGILGVVAGLIMLFRPGVGLASITMLLGIYFLIDGISEIIAAFKMKPIDGWGWLLFGGIVAVLLSFLIWRQWPVSGTWAVGVLVGIHILIAGITMIVFGFGARRVADTIEDAVEKAGDLVEDAYDKTKEVAGDVAEATGDAVDNVVDKAKEIFDDDD
jgi:uncharacterized membrane protein HdeD (DUF308 family)